MAISGNRLSSVPVVGNYTGASSLDSDDFVDYEDGGVGIQDPSRGMLYQVWTARVVGDGSSIVLSAPNTPEFVLVEGVGITHVSLAFDSNMQPIVAFVESGLPRLYWYDSQSGQVEITDFPGIEHPRLSLDDKRRTQIAVRDVIFAYMRSGGLYYRQQRDRFLVERLLKSGVPGVLKKIGMTDALRLQFQIDVPGGVPI